MRGLSSLRMDGHLCDVTLVAEGLQFQCHRVVLASASAYFRSMFTSNMIEKDKEFIELKDITSDGFDSILKFIYTNSIILSSRNIQYILHAATMLQVEPVIKFCCQYLEEEIRFERDLKLYQNLHRKIRFLGLKVKLRSLVENFEVILNIEIR